MEQELKADESLLHNFRFCCLEIGLPPTDVLPQIHHMLLEKMLHTHGNEMIQNRRMLDNIKKGKMVDVPLMLRDSLKVLATRCDPGTSKD